MGSICDPIADLLTRIRNAIRAKHRYVDVHHSKLKEAIVKTLKDQGYIAHYLMKEEKRKGTIRVFLKYVGDQESVIQELKRISKPSHRRYVPHKKIPVVKRGFGIAIISTPKGILEGKTAREQKLGGEVLCYVW
ncbi:MAG: 30S ribosomal protein S8 [Chlamydiales bacterium]